MKNKYGYFIYEDKPLEQPDDSVTVGFSQQYNTQPHYGVRAENKSASFEKGEFDFIAPPLGNWEAGYTISTELSDANGDFSENKVITIDINTPISGSGISIFSFNKTFKMSVTVTDENGTRSKTFSKNNGDWYPIIYNNATRIVLSFSKVEPYHFLKVVGYEYGKTRIIDDDLLVEEPEMVSHFSLTNEELEYDTLTFKVYASESVYNFVRGEKITYTRNNRIYYIDDAKFNNDGTAEVVCYDHIARLENKDSYGFLTTSGNLPTLIKDSLRGGYTDVGNIDTSLLTGAGYEGSMGIVEYREILRNALLCSDCRLKRYGNNNFSIIKEYYNPDGNFTENNIISVPQVERIERYDEATFIKHTFKKDKTNGRQVAFDGEVELDEEVKIEFNEPYKNYKYYVVTGQDQSGEDILLDVTADARFGVTVEGYYCVIFENHLEYDNVVIMGYPYKDSTKRITTLLSKSVTFEKNSVEVDCPLWDKSANSTIRTRLKSIYGWRKKITLDSVSEFDAGQLVGVWYDDKHYKGWITEKTDRANGVYSYEVTCK